MKRMLVLCCLWVLLSGCSQADRNMYSVMEFRDKLLLAEGGRFQAEISADYGQQIYDFTVACSADREGNVKFEVLEPESISGITGEVFTEGGRLTFDGTVLGFPLLADGMLSPASAPWVFLRSLRSGYLTSCAETDDGIRLTVNDSYEEETLRLDIWMHSDCSPYYAEILWKGRRILSLKIENFEIL